MMMTILAPFLLLLLLFIENFLDGLLLFLDGNLVTVHLKLEHTERVDVHPLFVIIMLTFGLPLSIVVGGVGGVARASVAGATI